MLGVGTTAPPIVGPIETLLDLCYQAAFVKNNFNLTSNISTHISENIPISTSGDMHSDLHTLPFSTNFTAAWSSIDGSPTDISSCGGYSHLGGHTN